VFQATELCLIEGGKNSQSVPVGMGQPTIRMEQMTVGGTAGGWLRTIAEQWTDNNRSSSLVGIRAILLN
jgi:hypothetical protein